MKCAPFLLLLVLTATSCRSTRVIVIPADREVRPMPAGQPFTPPVRGWFVPDARMQELLQRGLVRTNEVR